MLPLPKRIVVHTKDVENITGRRPRTAQAILQKIKNFYNKEKSKYITIQEFCEFMGMKEDYVRQFLTAF
jgi:hypothetical protein